MNTYLYDKTAEIANSNNLDDYIYYHIVFFNKDDIIIFSK